MGNSSKKPAKSSERSSLHEVVLENVSSPLSTDSIAMSVASNAQDDDDDDDDEHGCLECCDQCNCCACCTKACCFAPPPINVSLMLTIIVCILATLSYLFFKYNLTTLCESYDCAGLAMEGIRLTTWTSWLLIIIGAFLGLRIVVWTIWAIMRASFGKSSRPWMYIREIDMSVSVLFWCLATYLFTAFYLGLSTGVAYDVLRSLIVIIAVWAGSNIFSNLLITLINYRLNRKQLKLKSQLTRIENLFTELARNKSALSPMAQAAVKAASRLRLSKSNYNTSDISVSLNQIRTADVSDLFSSTMRQSRKMRVELDQTVIDELFRRIDVRERGYFNKRDLRKYFQGGVAILNDLWVVFAEGNKDERHKVYRSVFTNKIQQVQRKAKQVQEDLKNREFMGRVLKVIVRSLFAIIGIIVVLLLLGVELTQLIAALGILFVGSSFAFSEIVRDAFTSFMFLTNAKPYQVGDIVLVDNVRIVIAKVALFTTIAHGIDGTRHIMNNATLARKVIINESQSKECGFLVSIEIGAETPRAKIDHLDYTLRKYMKDHPDTWKEERFLMQILDYNAERNLLMLEIRGFARGINWLTAYTYGPARTQFYHVIREKCRDLGIRYRQAELPVRLMENTESDDDLNARFSSQSSPNSSPRKRMQSSFDDAGSPSPKRSGSRATSPKRARSTSRTIPLERNSPYGLRSRAASITNVKETSESPQRQSSKTAADLESKPSRKSRAASIVMIGGQSPPNEPSKMKERKLASPLESPRSTKEENDEAEEVEVTNTNKND